ncbi:hypothetical protein GW17_00010337 [Ensete ventricosum]|nr:hypothetical protein GW17_00010337 [Ensete ventricosum]RZR97384.1 hypothetical protein BHM03_00026556 [Ensete ventricosum]
MGQAMRRATGRVRPGRPDQLTLPVQRTTRPPAVDRPPLLRTAKIGSASPAGIVERYNRPMPKLQSSRA